MTIRGLPRAVVITIGMCAVSFAHAECWQAPSFFLTYHSSGTDDDAAIAVQATPDGGIVVGGTEDRSDLGQSRNWIIRKYESSGALQWFRTYDSPAHGMDLLAGLVVDALGNVIAVGSEDRTDLGQSYNWLINKYDVAGNLVWSRSYTSPGNNADWATGVALAPGDGVIVVGSETRPLGMQWLVRRYDAAGTLLWSRTFFGVNDAPTAVASGADGTFVTAGYTAAGSSDTAWLAARHAGDGSVLWSRTVYGGANANGLPFIYGVAMDNAGGVVAVGGVTSGPVDLDWRIIKFDPFGGVGWSTIYGSSGNYRNDLASSVLLDQTGAAIVGGFVSREGTPYADWIVRSYSDSGSLLNSWTYRRASNWTGTPSGIAITASGDIVVAGYDRAFDVNPRSEWLVVKLATCAGAGTGTGSADQVPAGTVKIVGGIRGYVSPKRGEQANILIRPTSAGEVVVSIYDEAGKMVRSITVHYSGSGVESVHWDATNQTGGSVPPGLYHVVVKAPGVNATDTVAVIR